MDHALASASSPSQQQIAAAFDTCHKKVIWTYETIVATDFLPRFSAEATLNRVAPGALHAYQRGTPPTSRLPRSDGVKTFLYSCKPGRGENAEIHIPHEFAVAALEWARRDKLVPAGELDHLTVKVPAVFKLWR